MALSFSGLEAVKFGEIVATPTVTAEARLRIQSGNSKSAENREKLIKAMADCFGEQSEAVQDFMTHQMSGYELSLLQAYLVGGEKMLDQVEGTVAKAMEKGALNV